MLRRTWPHTAQTSITTTINEHNTPRPLLRLAKSTLRPIPAASYRLSRGLVWMFLQHHRSVTGQRATTSTPDLQQAATVGDPLPIEEPLHCAIALEKLRCAGQQTTNTQPPVHLTPKTITTYLTVSMRRPARCLLDSAHGRSADHLTCHPRSLCRGQPRNLGLLLTLTDRRTILRRRRRSLFWRGSDRSSMQTQQKQHAMRVKDPGHGYGDSPARGEETEEEEISSSSPLSTFRAKEEEIERKKMEVREKVFAQLGRAEKETKRLAEIREELEALADPTRKEVASVRKRIDTVNRELKPLGQSCLRKEKEYKEALEAFNEKNNLKTQLVNKLMELVTESERLRMKKLEELSKNIDSLLMN